MILSFVLNGKFYFKFDGNINGVNFLLALSGCLTVLDSLFISMPNYFLNYQVVLNNL